jgi:galactosylxylosylprotein 3-beta-galactosyltransferase
MATSRSFQLEGRQPQCLQEAGRNANPVAAYFLPFILGLCVGGGLVLLLHQGCVGLCPQQGEELVLVAHPETLQRDVIPVRNYSNGLAPVNPKVRVLSGCPLRPLHLFVLVLSAPAASLRRTAIRGTWGHNYRNKIVKVTIKFLVGLYELEKERVIELEKEDGMFGDLVLLKELKDSYVNLSAKVLMGIQWASHNLQFDYLVKVDDDSYVKVEGISEALRELRCDRNLYWGYFMGHAFPEPTGRWTELKWFQCPHYLPYAMGGGYVISHRTVELLAKFSDRLILYNNEDVTVASWLAPYQLNRVHDIRFNVESLSHGCNNGYLITHKVKVRMFYVMYTNLLRNGTLCDEEKEIHPAYIYNWTGSPLDCCQRVKGLPVG